MSSNNKTIALIGGAGFIGHHLALALKETGADVHAIDSLQVNNLLSFQATTERNPERQSYLHLLHERLEELEKASIPLHVQDAREYHQLSHVLSNIKPHIIIHLAAVAHANRSNKDPYSTFDHSLRTLENALDYARSAQIERFVYFSSSMVYGNFNGKAVTENSACNPIGIYGALKLAGEKIVIAYQQTFGLPYTIVRPSALYGERCVSRRVTQIFLENALHGKPIVIQGTGSDALDFTYVRDLVDGIIKALSPQGANETFNLTYGQARTIAELAEIVRTHVPSITIKLEPKDKLMPDRGTLDISKARKLLHYEPHYALETGIERYLNWYRHHLATPVRLPV